jgi:hypothetical protein
MAAQAEEGLEGKGNILESKGDILKKGPNNFAAADLAARLANRDIKVS